MTKKSIAWYAERYTEKFGMHLVPLKEASKLPLLSDWGNKTLNDPLSAVKYWTENPAHNIGVSLGDSGFCSFDIDCLESVKIIMEEFGIPVEELNAFPTVKGASKGTRVMFRVPEGLELPYCKLTWPLEEQPTDAKVVKRFTVLELRASTSGKQRQDALPPSIHPDTNEPYKWLVQPMDDWPEPPPWLLAIWGAWDDFKPQMQEACPWVSAPAPRQEAPSKTTGNDGSGSVIGAYCDAFNIKDQLVNYGYIKKGKRYLSPHSTTNLAGVELFPEARTCWIHHASDPLCSEENGKPVNAFDLFCYYDHDNDAGKAVKAAAKILGIEHKKKARPAKTDKQTPAPATTTHHGTAPQDAPLYKALGYNGPSYYYLPRGTEQVSEIRRGSMTSPAELMALAPLEFWEMAYPKAKGVDWQAAGNDLMRSCERAGIYSRERERGRGAWYDNGRAVLHLGDKLLVDGVQCAISDHDTRYIYTKNAPLENGKPALPADTIDGRKMAELFDGLNWSKSIHGKLLAGWCVLAPICGAMPWRPHVWLTAQRGAGKTWVQDHIINPMLGPAAMMVQGSTTEAGIRQKLKQDARPIVFDEAESEDQNAQKRMKTVIELARQSSSDSSAEIVKGTAEGNGMAFRMRSMFLLGSVNVSLDQAADESRFSIISLEKPDTGTTELDRFKAFSEKVDNTFTDAFCASIRARSYSLMSVIIENTAIIARAVAEVLNSQRLGDQVGTLLAGEYSLRHSGLISADEAKELVKGIDLSDAREAEQVSDEESCLNRMLQSQVNFDSQAGRITRSIGELIESAAGVAEISQLGESDENNVLGRFGIMFEKNKILVSNNHPELKRIMSDTPWASGWGRVLKRLDGAFTGIEAKKFAGVRSRYTSIPYVK